MSRRKSLIAAVTAICTATAFAGAQTAGAETFALSTSAATGDQVVPGPGDPNAYGGGHSMRLTLGGSKGGVGKIGRSAFFWSATGTPTAIHIHKGALGVAGPVVIELPLRPDDGYPWGHDRAAPDECVMLKLAMNPTEYYVDGHTDAYPDGALRAQLGPYVYGTVPNDQVEARKLYKETCKKKK
jgi:CHRD domain